MRRRDSGRHDIAPRSVAIVGNAPGMADQADRIDSADWVVRFNNAPRLGREAGRRVTHLALVNHGGQMREWLSEPCFAERPAVRDAQAFFFPFPERPRAAVAVDENGRDWTGEATAALAPHGGPILMLPDNVHRRAATILRTAAQPQPAPSTGFLVTLHLLRALDRSIPIDVHGFGFEGWDGHAWARERRWFERMAATGRLRLHPLRHSFAA